MKGSGRILALALLSFACIAMALAEDHRRPSCSDQASASPCIDKVDPPNWWTELPFPMLLLHGDHLSGAKLSASGKGISVEKTQVSANGHYAFLWLKTATAGAQQVQIRVSSSAGTAEAPFRISQRQAAAHAGFSPQDVMYLIMTDRFADGDRANDPESSQRNLARGWHGGDFRGIEQHLDYLQGLGITTLWTTPVYDNSGASEAYHGYSATNLYGTDPHFGTVADLQGLSDALHHRGMKLVLDTVPNHVGAANPWAFDPPTPDWFHGTRADHHVNSDQFQWLVDPHGTWEERRWVTDGWFANVLPDLNQENPLVRQYLIQNVIWWIETTGADGLRYDTFPYVGRAFWQDLNSELKTLYPHLTTVGEVFNPDPTITSWFAGGVAHHGIDTGLTTPFDFPTFFALRAALSHHDPVAGGPVRHNDMRAIETVLRDDWLYPHPEQLVLFIGNHDTTRFMSQPGVEPGDLKLAFALLATLRGMPQIYSGDEIAMRGGEDPDNRHDFPGGFPGDEQSAFSATGRTPEEAEMHDWVASLFRLRRAHPVLATGEQQDLLVDPTAFVFARAADLRRGCGTGEHFLIAVNDSDQPRELDLALSRTALDGCATFTAEGGGSGIVHSSDSGVHLSLSPKQAVIYQAR